MRPALPFQAPHAKHSKAPKRARAEDDLLGEALQHAAAHGALECVLLKPDGRALGALRPVRRGGWIGQRITDEPQEVTTERRRASVVPIVVSPIGMCRTRVDETAQH